MMLGDAFSVETSGHLLSVGTGVAGTHGYYKGDAFGVINDMFKHTPKLCAPKLTQIMCVNTCPNYVHKHMPKL